MTNYDIPTGPIDAEPLGVRSDTDQIAALVDVLTAAGVELGDYDERIVAWLAGWEWGTVATIASWIKRASA